MPVDPKEHLKECKARLKKVVDDCGGHFMHEIICDYMFVMGQLGKETERADRMRNALGLYIPESSITCLEADLAPE